LKTTSTHAYHGIHDHNFAATKKKTGSMIVDSIKLAEVVDIDILMRRHARVLKVQVLIPPAAFAQFNWQEHLQPKPSNMPLW
jgi:hypothetical protein